MKLKEYMEMLKKMIEENPDCLEFEVITAMDDEGNEYDTVSRWGPCVGVSLYGHEEFCSNKEDWDEDQEFSYDKEDRKPWKPNAVCLN